MKLRDIKIQRMHGRDTDVVYNAVVRTSKLDNYNPKLEEPYIEILDLPINDRSWKYRSPERLVEEYDVLHRRVLIEKQGCYI